MIGQCSSSLDCDWSSLTSALIGPILPIIHWLYADFHISYSSHSIQSTKLGIAFTGLLYMQTILPLAELVQQIYDYNTVWLCWLFLHTYAAELYYCYDSYYWDTNLF